MFLELNLTGLDRESCFVFMYRTLSVHPGECCPLSQIRTENIFTLEPVDKLRSDRQNQRTEPLFQNRGPERRASSTEPPTQTKPASVRRMYHPATQ